MKKLIFSILCLFSFVFLFFPALSDTIIEPVCPVPEYVNWLLEIASEEVGYHEEDHGYTKYGEWAGDPYCQWCAEFLCWCVDQTDIRHHSGLLNNVFPQWSSSNTGRAWFIKAGRYVVKKGEVEDWGYEWLRGKDTYLSAGEYIPQPGDYIFFTWTSDSDTDHVALVEYCSLDENGSVKIHVIEGNNPSSVARNTYPLLDGHILGFGTVHDLVDITMRFGNNGEKVKTLQEKLSYLGFLDPQYISGNYGNATVNAIREFQTLHGIKANGIANRSTQLTLDREIEIKIDSDPLTWLVTDDEEE